MIYVEYGFFFLFLLRNDGRHIIISREIECFRILFVTEQSINCRVLIITRFDVVIKQHILEIIRATDCVILHH
jgi:hypothetical protein